MGLMGRRWRAWGIPRSPAAWRCMGSGGAGGSGLAGLRARSPPQKAAVAGHLLLCGLTSRVGRGAGTLPVHPGAVLVWSGVVCGPGVRGLRGGDTKRVAPRPRRPPP